MRFLTLGGCSMHMKKLFLYTLFVTALAVLGAVATQGDRIDADFSNAADADAFVAAAHGSGQGKGAQVTHNEDGTTSVTLPEVATEMMAETAMDAIAEHANAIVISECPCWTQAELDAIGGEADRCFELEQGGVLLRGNDVDTGVLEGVSTERDTQTCSYNSDVPDEIRRLDVTPAEFLSCSDSIVAECAERGLPLPL